MIPKIIHQVWLGQEPIPEIFLEFSKKWKADHPRWMYAFWDDKAVSTLSCNQILSLYPALSSRSNVVRIEIIRKIGGVYVDFDIENLKNINNLISSYDAFAGYEDEHTVCNALFGAVQNHPWIEWQWDRIVTKCFAPAPWGPRLMTDAAAVVPIQLFKPEIFYPYHYSEWEEKHAQKFPDAYAVHHWCKSWDKTCDRIASYRKSPAREASGA